MTRLLTRSAKSSTAIRSGSSFSTAKRQSSNGLASDSTYGSRHLAAKWGRDGTLNQITAFMLADMIGDKDLDIQKESRSTPWLISIVADAAKKFGYQRYFSSRRWRSRTIDILPFVQRGVPAIDVIDLDYGPNNSCISPHGAGYDG